MINDVKVIYKRYKTALNKLKYPDSWFWGRYTINPYSGCVHACIYCDARSNRYYLQQDFENEVIVKLDIDKILESKIKNARTLLPDVVAPGGVNDAYQPIEIQEKNTLNILKVFKKYKFPINLATKSSLIARDISLLNEIAKDTWCTVGFSITTTDEQLASFLEPYSSPPKERLKVIKKIKEKGPQIQVGTYFMPIIPYLEDNEDNLEDVIKQSKNHGADFILFAPGLTLRDSQAQFFIKKIKQSPYKDILTPLLNLFKGKTQPSPEYVKKIHSNLYRLCSEYNIPIRVKRWIPNDFRKWNYKVSELLLNKEYMEFITTGRSNFNLKWAGLNLNNLKESIIDISKRGELSKLPNFTSEIVELVEPILKDSKEYNKRKGIDEFL
jgi:DNA repair photolyase